jgi:hypothetical protein
MNPTRAGAGLNPCQGVGELSYLSFPWKCSKNVEWSGSYARIFLSAGDLFGSAALEATPYRLHMRAGVRRRAQEPPRM